MVTPFGPQSYVGNIRVSVKGKAERLDVDMLSNITLFLLRKRSNYSHLNGAGSLLKLKIASIALKLPKIRQFIDFRNY